MTKGSNAATATAAKQASIEVLADDLAKKMSSAASASTSSASASHKPKVEKVEKEKEVKVEEKAVAKPANDGTSVKFDKKHLESLTTKSAKIRYLYGLGMKTGDIARELGILYQHVRNVLVVPVKQPRDQ